MTGFWKVFGATALVVAVALVLVAALLVDPLAGHAEAFRAQELRGEAELLADVVRPALRSGDRAQAGRQVQELVRGLAARLPERRFTVVASDGAVLADSHEDPSRMNNHADREELVAAGQGGAREPVLRRSLTLELDMLYYATPVRDGLGAQAPVLGYARVALPGQDLDESAALVRGAVLRAAAIALLAGAALAALLARGVHRPVGEIATFVGAIARGQPAVKLRGCRAPSTTWPTSSSSASAASSATRRRSGRFSRAWSRACWRRTPTSACCSSTPRRPRCWAPAASRRPAGRFGSWRACRSWTCSSRAACARASRTTSSCCAPGRPPTACCA
jgi:hypothetical protein